MKIAHRQEALPKRYAYDCSRVGIVMLEEDYDVLRGTVFVMLILTLQLYRRYINDNNQS